MAAGGRLSAPLVFMTSECLSCRGKFRLPSNQSVRSSPAAAQFGMRNMRPETISAGWAGVGSVGAVK